MLGKSLKSRLFILLLSESIALAALLSLVVVQLISYSSNEVMAPSAVFQSSSLLKLEFFVLSALLILMCVTFAFLHKFLLIPLRKLKEGIDEYKNGSVSHRLDIGGDNEIGEIACAFNSMAVNLEHSYKKLEAQTNELSSRNWELEEANTELEASYGQLQAIIEQLNEAEQKYHSLVRNIPDVVCVIDYSGSISFVNHVCIDVLGYEKSEVIGKSIMSLASSSGTFSLDEIIYSLKDKSTVTVELPLVKKDGTVITTEIGFTSYVCNGITMGLQAIVRDITEKRKMEEKVIQSNKELSILNSVSKSLTSTLDIDTVSRVVVNEIATKLDFPACVLRLMDNSGTNLYVKAYSGPFFEGIEVDADDFGTISLKDDLMEKVVNNSEILRTMDIPDGWFIGKVNKFKPETLRVKEVLTVPISVKNKRIGTLGVGSTSAVKPSDMSLISSIANNAAVAIDNALLYDSSKKYFIRTIDALIAAVEAKDKYTEGHSQRVSKYAVEIATKLGLSKEQVEDIKIAGILHDIGKIGISDNILLKPGKLTNEEYEEIKQHPAISNKILYPVGFSERTLKAITFHHERYDGKGYPFGLCGENIALEAQIIAVADAFDAMTSNRSYRRAMSIDEAVNELINNKSTQFSPSIVDAFIELTHKEPVHL